MLTPTWPKTFARGSEPSLRANEGELMAEPDENGLYFGRWIEPPDWLPDWLGAAVGANGNREVFAAPDGTWTLWLPLLRDEGEKPIHGVASKDLADGRTGRAGWR